jgi:eukaryotic-like serine/threonine-protein kinase
MTPPNYNVPAAAQLAGMTLDGGWKVIRLIPRRVGATGGNFSFGYEVESTDGKRPAFLKALDYSSALMSPDPAMALNAMTSAYIFERDLLERCRNRRLNRIVTAVSGGKLIVPGAPTVGLVEYLIFEAADGDIRKQLAVSSGIDLSWCLQSLHHIATGLKQLHGEKIAHQDVKPSNVLVFSRESKLADLGRASCVGEDPPHEPYWVAGDPSYAPPELLYGFVSPDWTVRRLGCDAYLLGSMVVWFFTGLSATSLLINSLPGAYKPGTWLGTYEQVLPYIRDAFSQVLETFSRDAPAQFLESLSRIVKELCEPDPSRRGHTKDVMNVGNQFGLQRYITEFDLLAKRAALNPFG